MQWDKNRMQWNGKDCTSGLLVQACLLIALLCMTASCGLHAWSVTQHSTASASASDWRKGQTELEQGNKLLVAMALMCRYS